MSDSICRPMSASPVGPCDFSLVVVPAPGGLTPGQTSCIVLMRLRFDFPWTVNFIWYNLCNPEETVNYKYDGNSLISMDSEIRKL